LEPCNGVHLRSCGSVRGDDPRVRLGSNPEVEDLIWVRPLYPSKQPN